MAKRTKQLSMLANEKSAYGGELLKTRAGRRHGRPLSTRESMHLVLRSSKAKGDWSFRKPRNEAHVNRIVDKFAFRYGVRVISMANVGNHLHLQIKLSNRFAFKPFIRAATAAIAMAVTGGNRWTRQEKTLGDAGQKEAGQKSIGKLDASMTPKRDKFWDYRPYTRVVQSFKAWLTLNDYIKINRFEGEGYKREDARFMLKVEKQFASEPG